MQSCNNTNYSFSDKYLCKIKSYSNKKYNNQTFPLAYKQACSSNEKLSKSTFLALLGKKSEIERGLKINISLIAYELRDYPKINELLNSIQSENISIDWLSDLDSWVRSLSSEKQFEVRGALKELKNYLESENISVPFAIFVCYENDMATCNEKNSWFYTGFAFLSQKEAEDYLEKLRKENSNNRLWFMIKKNSIIKKCNILLNSNIENNKIPIYRTVYNSTREYFENIPYPWSVTSFDSKSRNVCIEVKTKSGSRYLSVTLPEQSYN